MVQKFVNRFNERKPAIAHVIAKAEPESYKDLVQKILSVLAEGEDPYDDYDYPIFDPEIIHEIDDGDYQGTLLYIIPAKDYQPSQYYSIKISYGSCSGCDTLQAISSWDNSPMTVEQLRDYMQLALHIVQNIKKV